MHATTPDISREAIYRAVGQLEARQNSQDIRLASIETKVDMLLGYMQTSKGGLRMLIAVGSVASGLGGVAAWLAHLFTGKP